MIVREMLSGLKLDGDNCEYGNKKIQNLLNFNDYFDSVKNKWHTSFVQTRYQNKPKNDQSVASSYFSPLRTM